MQAGLRARPIEANLLRDVVIESRDPVPDIEEYLQNALEKIQSLRYVVDGIFDSEKAFETLDKQLPNGRVQGQKECFINDIIRLCNLFLRFKKRETRMQLQLEIIQNDMCRLFHQDHYRQRLLCTYKGPGTEWLDPSNVNMEALGKGCNAKIVRDFSKVHKTKAFEVLLIKGAKYEKEGSGVVHRSPPVEKEKLTRVLLKIDEWSKD